MNSLLSNEREDTSDTEARTKHLEIERARRKRLGDTFTDLDQVCLAAMPRLALQRRDRRNILINAAAIISSLLQENMELKRSQALNTTSLRHVQDGSGSLSAPNSPSLPWQMQASLEYQSPSKRLRRPSVISTASTSLSPNYPVASTSPNGSLFGLPAVQPTPVSAPAPVTPLSTASGSRRRFREDPDFAYASYSVSDSEVSPSMRTAPLDAGLQPKQAMQALPFASVSSVLLRDLLEQRLVNQRSSNGNEPQPLHLPFNVTESSPGPEPTGGQHRVRGQSARSRINVTLPPLDIRSPRPESNQFAVNFEVPSGGCNINQDEASVLQQLIAHLQSSSCLPGGNGATWNDNSSGYSPASSLPVPVSPASENSFAIHSPSLTSSTAHLALGSLSAFAPSHSASRN